MFSILTVLPADSTAASDVRSALNKATQPIDFNLSHLFSSHKVNQWVEGALNFGIRIVLCLILFWIGRWVIGKLRNLFDKILRKRQIDGVAVSLLDSVFVALLYAVLIITLASILGVKSVSFAAVLASLGLAVGMALSGQLQNFAGGVIIMVTKPFSIGDYIVAQGAEGTVRSVRLFYTEVLTPDNKLVFLPNGSLSSGSVTNYSHEELRRAEWTIGIEYDSDIEVAREAILELFRSDERILQEPAPTIVLHNLGASSVDLLVRAWVKSSDLWPVYWSINERVYNEFNKRGIGFPFPQLTVHQDK